MMEEVKIVQTQERELHFMGEYVAVCWNIKPEVCNIEQDGYRYRAVKFVRMGEPYIDYVFADRIGESNGEYYESHHRPAEGGMSVGFALQLIEELNKATKYISNLGE